MINIEVASSTTYSVGGLWNSTVRCANFFCIFFVSHPGLSVSIPVKSLGEIALDTIGLCFGEPGFDVLLESKSSSKSHQDHF